MGLMDKIFGTYSERELKRIYPIRDKVLALDEQFSKMSDQELKAMTPKLKERLSNGESLDDILPEAFATCREAAWRVLGMKHFPVQIVGGIVLHQGRIAEMKTGEGKTLVATLPVYLNALTGKGVHVVTVNDYLAKRDSEEMGKVYRWLGLTVGLVPTMGYLHEGHQSLIARSVAENDRTVVSDFVNPIQFGPTEDLATYPRDIERDAALCESTGANLIFHPEADEMYAPDFCTYVDICLLYTSDAADEL